MEKKKIHILLFYKYVGIKDLDDFRKKHLDLCNNLRLKGRILVAEEGINGSVSGSEIEIEKYKKYMWKDWRFTDLKFKEDSSIEHPFKKMVVKIKQKILAFDNDVDINNKGKYISPKEFLDLYDDVGNLKNDVVLVDNRNEYEWKVGRFKGALKPGVQKFREFPKIAENLKGQEDKKIVMYCTGGIRCEKASAYLKEQGFNDVSQLHGGILEFGRECDSNVWEGKCFVFDRRLLSSINSNNENLTNCELCNKGCDHYKDCRNPRCNRFVSLCSNCFDNFNGCCSDGCLEKYVGWLKEKEIKNMPIKI